NALDAMPDGGKLTVATSNERMEPGAGGNASGLLSGDKVVVSVTDTGPGMAADVVDKIFEPFYTTKALGRGTGLGLAIVEGIVRQSGGQIDVRSAPGRGTTFKIYLARSERARDALTGKNDQPEISGGTETILLVEDEPAVRELAVRTLRSRGYNVLEAPDGKAALALGKRFTTDIHLLLTDMSMPEMNGRELADRLVALRPGTKVAYMSGYMDNEILEQERSLRGRSFLQKPFMSNALLEAVREALDSPETVAGE
ncbi:MAG: response regulator, partial [Deltaproteobacteria bacterium]|nr:response regulator [Deltaproteobacteria bacterium]